MFFILGFDFFFLFLVRDLYKFLDFVYIDEMIMSEEVMEEVIMVGMG